MQFEPEKLICAILYTNETAANDALLRLKSEFGEASIFAARTGQPNPIDIALAFYPDVNEFRGSVTLQLIITDWCRIPQKT